MQRYTRADIRLLADAGATLGHMAGRFTDCGDRARGQAVENADSVFETGYVAFDSLARG